MKKLILLTVLVSGSAFAQLDMSIYKNSGNYNSQPQAYEMRTRPEPTYEAPVRYQQTDYTCMNSCTSAGLMYAFCQSKCSY